MDSIHARLLELARQSATDGHWTYVEEDWKAGHRAPIERCPHPNCRLIRELSAVEASVSMDLLRELKRQAIALASNPYGDEVCALGSDEPKAVGDKIARAIEAINLDALCPMGEKR